MPAQSKTFVIVGNGAAGTTAAENLRRGDAEARIVLLAAEPYPLYNRIALPPYLKGKVPESKVFIRDREWHQKHRIELRLSTRVTAVDTEQRLVCIEEAGELAYDGLLIATGGTPNRLPVSGAGAPNVFQFQTLDDARGLIDQIRRSRRAVAVGGSFIGYELAEAFRGRGLETVWLMRGPRFLHRVLDDEGGALVDRLAREAGVEVYYEDNVAEVAVRDGLATGVRTTAGRDHEAEIIGYGLGLTLNTGFLAGSGIEVGRGVHTDSSLRTSAPDVYAAGDVAAFLDTISGQRLTVGAWNHAVFQGRTAAENLLGGNAVYREVPSYSSTMFDSTLAMVGVPLEPGPGVETISRLDWENGAYRRLFFKDGRLMGAMLIGERRGRRGLVDLITSGAVVEDRQALLAD